MCALPKGFDALVVLDGTDAGEKSAAPRTLRPLDVRRHQVYPHRESRAGWVEACIANRCEEVRHGR